MVDTLYIYYNFKSYEEYKKAVALTDEFVEANANKSKDTLHKDNKHPYSVVTYMFANKGFEEIRFRSLFDNGYYAIEILLRPKLLVDKNNYINVLYEDEVDTARNKFNKFLQDKVGLDVPDMLKWKVKRIDYAIDIRVKQDLIPQYIELFKHGNIPHYALENEVTQMWFNKANNFYLVNKNYVVNFYDRYATLQIKQKQYNKKFTDIERAKSLLRLEIQLTVSTDKMKRKGQITKNELGQFLNVELCKSYIMQHFDSIIGAGNYYTIETAKSKCKSDVLYDIIKLINSEGSIHAAKELYLLNKRNPDRVAKRFSKLINDLRRKNVNPVILPEHFNCNKLKGLRPIIEEYFDAGFIRIKRRKKNYE